MRSRIAVLTVIAMLLLTGCATVTPPKPTTQPTPTTNAPSPTATASSPTPIPGDDGSEFTGELIIDLCVEKTREDHSPDPQFDRDNAVIEEVEGEAPWFVIIPVVSSAGDAISFCTIGGAPESPTFVIHGAAVPEQETEVRSWVTPKRPRE